MSSGKVIHWFRRDLRLSDNLALHAAAAQNQRIIPIFILDDHLLKSKRAGAARVVFLLASLKSLDNTLRQLGTHLHIFRGDPLRILSKLVQSEGVTAIYANRDYSPYAIQRDEAVTRMINVPFHLYDDALLLPPGAVRKSSGEPYVVFTPFKQNWNAQKKPEVSRQILTHENFVQVSVEDTLTQIPSPVELGFENVTLLAPASEKDAHKFLEHFVAQDIYAYSEKRNQLPIAPFQGKRPSGTSYLSPYLRLGLLSPRQAYWAARHAYEQTHISVHRESIRTWVSELTWRDFYAHILAQFPHVIHRDFVPTYEKLEWLDTPDELEAWKQGMTGYPIIDAAMRQLNTIGWMPNRARMIVASFLTKDLLIHWREGEVYFMQKLIDGDPASNNGGWQWAAGTGTDAQPYFRIFNPVTQSRQYATPEYLRYWIPELASVPDDKIHAPWEMKQPPRNYPAPIVDHGAARERALNAFKSARRNS